MAISTRNGPSLAALEACPPEVREILQAAMSGAELTFEQGLVLATADDSALQALVAVADHLRDATVGDAITYVVNRNINFTNVCFVGCSFCGFGRGPGAADAYSLSFEEMVRRAQEAWDRGATEVCIQGGLPRDLDGFFYRDLLRAIKRAIPAMHVHAFSPMEIDYGVAKTGMPLRDYRGARTGHSHHLHDDVWTSGRAGRLGAAHAAASRDSKTHWWIYGVRSTGIHP